MESSSLRLSFKASYDSFDAVHSRLQEFCLENGIVGLLQSGIINAVIEALNNIVEHTFVERQGEVSLYATFLHNALNVRIEDNGPPMQKRSITPLDFDPANLADLPEGGMGIAIIQGVMDKVTYAREGNLNIVAMTKQLQRS